MPCTCSGCGTDDGSLLVRLFPALPGLWEAFPAELCWLQAPLDLAGIAPPSLCVCVSWARARSEVFFCFLLSSQGNIFIPHVFKLC